MLSPKPSNAKLTARHPVVREHPAIVEAFKRKCAQVGITQGEGIRQLIASYLAHPFKLHPRVWNEDRSAHYTGAKNTPEQVAKLAQVAVKNGTQQGEVIRQLIHRYLEQP
ncbi:hypothetical protein [Novilysobacter arseniciresistens]|uniref:hypothetical protein n=1 Tax=Novilysobacter arseniciresistens TaxID=1385522 RepID=UPI00126A55B1|nr:hypothetical protein [Lysobacter arseniciresistens]